MGLETVKDEIISSAKHQEQDLIAEARNQASEITKKAELKIQEIREKSDTETKRIIDMIKKQELASAELDNKKALLEAKKQIIDKVFNEAKNRIQSLNPGKRQEYINKLLEKAKQDIKVENIYCSKEDIKMIKGLNTEAADMLGGIMAENKEKTIRVDYCFDSMMQNIKENELQGINKILFG